MVKPLTRPKMLITGASGGIGEAFARLAAERGYDLALVARNRNRLTELATELEEQYQIQAIVLAMDLTDPEAPERIFATLREKAFPISFLVNNAGFGLHGEFSETDWAKDRDMIAVNITALTHLAKLFAHEMKLAGRGRIVNVASTAAFQPGPVMAVYYATKAYVLSFSEALAEELAGTGVTVTALCPGPTETGFQKEANLGNIPLLSGKLPTAASVARYGYEAAQKGRRIAIPGFANRLVASLVRFLPRRFVTRSVKRLHKKG